jgi:hypothetical protein
MVFGDLQPLQRSEELPSEDIDVSRVSSFSYKAAPGNVLNVFTKGTFDVL